MNRIMVLGCCGAGKSTLSKKLGEITGLPVIHLDQYYWKPNWTESEAQEWSSIVTDLAERPQWIIDGNYGGTIDIRIEKADTIIYLDYSTMQCLWRITKRILKYKGKVRPDMPDGCRERFDLAFYHYVATYNLIRRKKMLKKLMGLKDRKNILILHNDKEVASYLMELAIKDH